MYMFSSIAIYLTLGVCIKILVQFRGGDGAMNVWLPRQLKLQHLNAFIHICISLFNRCYGIEKKKKIGIFIID